MEVIFSNEERVKVYIYKWVDARILELTLIVGTSNLPRLIRI